MTTITRKDQTLDDLRAAGLDRVARDIASRGYVAIVTLEAGVPATQAYLTKRGRLDYVAGSRSLLERYTREQRGVGVPV